MLRRAFIATSMAAALACTLAPAAQAQGLREINFGIISTEQTANLKQDWQPLLDDMQKRTGIKVNAFFASDYAGIIEGMRFNKVQVAWYGNKAAMEAVDRASGEIFAQFVASDGAPGYWSLLIAHKDSPYNSLEDVLKNGKSINFGIGDPNSTSGFLVPSYYVFALNKVDPRTLFKTVRAANHETNLLAVINKQVDVATNNTENWDKFAVRYPERIKDLKVLWKSPLIPSDPLVYRRDLPEETKQKVREFLFSYGSGADATREKAILNKLQAAKFQASSNRQLIPIRQLELFRERVKLEADDKMAEADRRAKLAEVNGKLAELDRQLSTSR